VKTRENAAFISSSLSADRLDRREIQVALLSVDVGADRVLLVKLMGQSLYQPPLSPAPSRDARMQRMAVWISP